MAGASVISAIVLYAGIIWAVRISAVKIPPSSTYVDFDTTSTDKAAVDISSIEEHLLSVQMSAVKSIQSPDGDTIDCIPPSKQLAFHHPSLKDHKLQEAPSTTIPHISRQANYKLSQVWQQHGRCPNGTIPVRRITNGGHNLRRSSSSPKHAGKRFNGDPQIVAGVEHEHSFGYTGDQAAYYGTQAIFSLWEPYVETSSEFSLAQLWVFAISPDDNNENTLEAGWQVDPGAYGDNNPHLFVYWTRDSYKATGCYNLRCSGFVQTSANVLLGGTISTPVSTINGSQFEITLLVFKDPTTGNWWLEYNGEYVGYWPHNLSYLTTNYASQLQWGGEIVNTEQNGQHTTTQMGSGNFAEAGYEQAAYIRNIQWVDGQNTLQSVSNLLTMAENVTCYDIIAGSDNMDWGTYFYFGGPGRNSNCP